MASRDAVLIRLAKANEKQKAQCNRIAMAIDIEPLAEVKHWPDQLYRNMEEAEHLAAFLTRLADALLAPDIFPTPDESSEAIEAEAESSGEAEISLVEEPPKAKAKKPAPRRTNRSKPK